ncbi:ethanolamine ammonia-lyase subunit EutC [Ideonella sp.]|uniref:ethanolamine ammonia-lyase subunit EutC n=1 Tax=Ideonella sp. TaxID=1929293 RepID=UPI002B47F699|nr:ethanolamine ammonia-lyase subunit EutC [Ideonella sp.]HJV70229.1 ethanolamine ammonia-lyase subunit EutC [Ideonella sp.]
MKSNVVDNGWAALRRHTPARIALGRAGVSLPTEPHLAFQLAHAQARDAVHRPFDAAAVASALSEIDWPSLTLHSAAPDRGAYLQRPDLGRRLSDKSAALLRRNGDATPNDLAVVVADGLSALAVERHAVPFLARLRELLRDDPAAWRLAPAAIVHQGRVAIGDEVGALLGARLVLVLIGERPGLSSPDSMGLYLTWAPQPGRTDAERNCISNVRPEGLAISEAAGRTAWLLRAARARAITGVGLKDESVVQQPLSAGGSAPFALVGESRR